MPECSIRPVECRAFQQESQDVKDSNEDTFAESDVAKQLKSAMIARDHADALVNRLKIMVARENDTWRVQDIKLRSNEEHDPPLMTDRGWSPCSHHVESTGESENWKMQIPSTLPENQHFEDELISAEICCKPNSLLEDSF